jgi:hypothetical protein
MPRNGVRRITRHRQSASSTDSTERSNFKTRKSLPPQAGPTPSRVLYEPTRKSLPQNRSPGWMSRCNTATTVPTPC